MTLLQPRLLSRNGYIGGDDITGVFHQRVSAKPCETVGLSFRAEATYLFDAETGKRLV